MKVNKTEYKTRVWEIQSQCEYNGEPIWTEDIVKGLIKFLDKTNDSGEPLLKNWAWIIHDQDIRSEYDEEDDYNSYLTDYDEEITIGKPEIGEMIPKHIHLVLEFKNPRGRSGLLKTIRKNFSPRFGKRNIHPPKAQINQFYAIATYLTHMRTEENRGKKKHIYPDDAVNCSFKYTETIDRYLATKEADFARIKKSKTELADRLTDQLERGEITIEDAKEECKKYKGFAYFLSFEKYFRSAHAEYVKKKYEMRPRMNIFICGDSGTGKSTLSQRVAEALYPDLDSNECFYTIGGAGVRFDNYEYQPVLLWEDIRASVLISEYKTEGVLNLMEPNPKKRSYNIKFGKVTLIHEVNIFTSTETFDSFVKVLMGAPDSEADLSNKRRRKKAVQDPSPKVYEEIEQAYRRFPIVINVKQNEVEVLRNTRIFDKDKKSEFVPYARILNVNIAELNAGFASDALDLAFEKITAPMVHLHEEFKELQSGKNKWTGEDESPEDIEIIEGYDKLAELQEGKQYTDFCKAMLDKHRLPDGTLGPYNHDKRWTWTLNDKMDVDPELVFYPFTFDQWIEMGRPKQYKPFIDGRYGQAQDRALVNRAEWLEAHPAIGDYIRAVDSGENPLFPYEYSQKDIDDYRDLILGIPKEGDGSGSEGEMEVFCDYVKEFERATNIYVNTKRMSDLEDWIQCLQEGIFPYSESIRNNAITRDAWSCWLECWNSVKHTCAEVGIITSEAEWFGMYQKLSYNYEDNNDVPRS